jgi:DNA-binding MarR family transcriptional regulator
MLIESLKFCPYRDSRLGYLLCQVSAGAMPTVHNRNFAETCLTEEAICRECFIPEIVQQVNCTHLDVGKQNQALITQTHPTPYFQSVGSSINCSVIGFSDSEDYKEKCSIDCPFFRPIHKDICNEEPILMDRFDASNATDKDLRQAVLAILYQYHARHPERFNCFDVTPDFISRCLGIKVQDVVRVVAPMEEEGEVTTKRYAHDLHFRYVTIRSKGIRMIDEEPLFERFNTAQVRSEMNFYGPSYGISANVEDNQQISQNDPPE